MGKSNLALPTFEDMLRGRTIDVSVVTLKTTGQEDGSSYCHGPLGGGRSDASFDPLYAHLARLNVPIIIHPLEFSHGQRPGAFFMVETLGQSLEEIIAINHLIFGGVLERHPALKVLIVNGGGYFPFYLGRMDHAWAHRPELRRLTRKRPSDYVRSMWYDTRDFAPHQIRQLVDAAGAERLMLGSDYPFDMGDPDPVGTIDAAGLTSEERASVRFGTARTFFGLENLTPAA